MAEQIPYGVAEGLINKLASLAFREFGRIYGVSDELNNLHRTLDSIKVVLSDAEQKQSDDPVIQHWICRFKQVLHDADDLLDDLAIEDLRRKAHAGSKVREFFSSDNPLVFRAKLARKIEKIRKEFNDVTEEMSRLRLNPSVVVVNQNESNWRETSSFVLESDIVGREENKDEIMNLLKQTHTDKNVSMIAVVGIGGLGKTALAQLVYNNAQELKLFQKYVWVCISEDFEVKTVLKKMLQSLKKNEVGDLDLDILQQMLREELSGQRYMLVLDDVWNESQLKWDAFRPYLMCGGEGSKVLATTRSAVVSQTMGINTPYVLKGLTEEQSWNLLKKVTFGDDVGNMSPCLASIGEKIAEKCGGVPLAIRTMGGVLRSKHDEIEWMKILDGDFWRQCGEREGILPVLKLSFQNLPLELRQCFAYCCLYPKDWEIYTNELIQLWMAHGYLGIQSMEDMGNQYVKILLMKSFFQDASLNEYGFVTSFKMHDLMHDLAMLVAGNDCFLDREGKEITGAPVHVSFLSGTVVASGGYPLDRLKANKLRTIFGLQIKDEFVVTPLTISNLKYLRVLDLTHSSITELPKFIDKFKHLRYLDLSECVKLISLPKSIGNLVMLQTLKLNGCSQLVFDVEVITKLISLRHLEIHYCKAFKEMMPAGLGKLVSLQHLSCFVVGDDAKRKSGKLNELNELNNIGGYLEIVNLGVVKDVLLESQNTNLKEKKRIRFLQLGWGPTLYETGVAENKNSDSLQLLDNLCPHRNLRRLMVSGYPGESFSSWLSSLTNIVEIVLRGFPNCQHLPPLETLPFLKMLHIENMEEVEWIHYEEISPVFFPSLESLYLRGCKNLRGWLRLRGDNNSNDDNNLSLPPFPRLSSLTIKCCPNLNSMPTFPYLVEELKIEKSSVKPLIETCLVQVEAEEESSSSFFPLSTFKLLKIGEVEAMAEEWMQNLTSLKCLSLLGTSIVGAMLRYLQHLPSQLHQLEFKYADGDTLNLWKDEAPFHCLRSLQNISFYDCQNLKALPEQIGDLQSLGHVEIYKCPKLESLPEAMRCLTSLQSLHIRRCPLLVDRCKDESGQDWPKIAHIPQRIIWEN